MQSFFNQADVTKDGLVSLEEIKKFLKKKQLVLPKEKLIELIKVKLCVYDASINDLIKLLILKDIDKNNDCHFDREEFTAFMNELSKREDIIKIFDE